MNASTGAITRPTATPGTSFGTPSWPSESSRNERPTHLISTGAAVAVPFFYVGRLVGARLAFIETFDRIDTPTLTGRIVAPITQHMLVQSPDQLGLYRRAELLGPLL